MSLRYGYDGDLLDAYEAIQKEHGGAMAEAYHALREALAVRIPELSETDTPQRPKE